MQLVPELLLGCGQGPGMGVTEINTLCEARPQPAGSQPAFPAEMQMLPASVQWDHGCACSAPS